MKAKTWWHVSLALVIVLTGSAGAIAQTASKDQLISYYERCITKKISNCNAKTVLHTSRSVHLRQKADLAARQIQFLSANKDMLINEMLEQGIGPKRYKVEHYLNKRFYEMNP